MSRMLIHNAIATIFGYLIVRYAIPYFIPTQMVIEFANSGLTEVIAIMVFVSGVYIIAKDHNNNPKNPVGD